MCIRDHQAFTLANKFLATTASIFAAAIGFAALAVSRIRPIREMGLWVASGLLLTWFVVFTLFPDLQKIFATPIRTGASAPGRGLASLFDALPGFTFRWRWPLLSLTGLLMIAGASSLFGIPGLVSPMRLETDSLAYIDRSLPLYKDTQRFEQAVSGLSVLQ